MEEMKWKKTHNGEMTKFKPTSTPRRKKESEIKRK